jgi:phosphonatase-like hydrolase
MGTIEARPRSRPDGYPEPTVERACVKAARSVQCACVWRASLIVFDMAGTTVHDDGLVLECFVAAAEAIGLDVTREELNERMGLSKLQVFDELSKRQLGVGREKEAAEMRDKGYDAFRRVLEGAYERGGVRPVAGTERVFAWLDGRGIKKALNTGFYRRVTEIIVDKLGWRDRVDAIVCGDDVREGRPAPYMIHEAMQRCGTQSVETVIVVGDTPSDMLAGKNSGARVVVGVTSGAHRGATLRRYPATHVVESVRDLPDIIERLERLGSLAVRSYW